MFTFIQYLYWVPKIWILFSERLVCIRRIYPSIFTPIRASGVKFLKVESFVSHKYEGTFWWVFWRAAAMKVRSESWLQIVWQLWVKWKVLLSLNVGMVVFHWKAVFLQELVWCMQTFVMPVCHSESSCFPLFSADAIQIVLQYFPLGGTPCSCCAAWAQLRATTRWLLKATCKEDFRILCPQWEAASSTQKLWKMQPLPMRQDSNLQGTTTHFFINNMI